MKKLGLLFIAIAVLMSSCASLNTALYAPSAIKADKGEMIHFMNVKAYEVLTPKLSGDGWNIKKQETTSGSLIQYKTEDGTRYWYVSRNIDEYQNSKFIPQEMKLKQVGYNSEEYTGKCEDMSNSKAYNYYCEDVETGESYKIRRFPWGTGYGYFAALVSDKGTIIYSLGVMDLKYY